MFTTYEVARKIVEIYKRQVSPFMAGRRAAVLVQNTRGQAEIVRLIERFRAVHAPDPSTPFWEARAAQPTRFETLEREVEWKLIEMPLPRLQVLGDAAHEFIYTIGWTTALRRSDVARAPSSSGPTLAATSSSSTGSCAHSCIAGGPPWLPVSTTTTKHGSRTSSLVPSVS